MSSKAATASAAVGEMPTYDPRPPSSRTFLLLVAIVLGGIGNLVNAMYGIPGGDVTVEWAAKHPSAWAAAMYGNALLGLGLLAVLAAVCVLVRRRGAAWATVSLAVGSLGTFLLMVSAPAQAAALIDYFAKHDMTQVAVAFPAFLLLLVTQLTVAVALIRSRAVPLWVPIVFLAGGVVETVFAGGGALTAALTVPQIVAEIAIGWYAWKKSTA